uniref:Uncharacterized protein n=1 Tax=Trichogramma kaykai TaxID=54128 RepID=A0ABD2WDY4_9HYME
MGNGMKNAWPRQPNGLAQRTGLRADRRKGPRQHYYQYCACYYDRTTTTTLYVRSLELVEGASCARRLALLPKNKERYTVRGIARGTMARRVENLKALRRNNAEIEGGLILWYWAHNYHYYVLVLLRLARRTYIACYQQKTTKLTLHFGHLESKGKWYDRESPRVCTCLSRFRFQSGKKTIFIRKIQSSPTRHKASSTALLPTFDPPAIADKKKLKNTKKQMNKSIIEFFEFLGALYTLRAFQQNGLSLSLSLIRALYVYMRGYIACLQRYKIVMKTNKKHYFSSPRDLSSMLPLMLCNFFSFVQEGHLLLLLQDM